MDTDQKIEQFSLAIRKAAEEEQKKILSEINKRLETEVEIIKQRVSDKAKEKINDELAKAVRERKKSVINVTLEAKKEILKLRDELQANIFAEVMSKLKLFINSPQYEQWLIERVLECKNELADYPAVVLVTQNDIKYKQKIEAAAGYKVQASESNLLGGCRVLCEARKIVIDKTIGNGYSEQKELFNKIRINT